VCWLLLACIACSTPSRPAPSNVGTRPLARPDAIAVQLGYRGTFMIGPPFSAVPPFTLLEDGTLIATAEGEPVHTTTLSRAEVDAIVQHVIDLGFEKLQSHPESCKQLDGNRSMCVSDASFTILRVALPTTGKLAEIVTYADFSNEPAIHDNIVAYLAHHAHPHTTPYRPRQAVMHVQPQTDPPIASCPAIAPALLHRADTSVWGVVLEGAELDAILALAPANNATWFACAGGAMYRLTLVPGVPGGDLDAELAVYRRR